MRGGGSEPGRAYSRQRVADWSDYWVCPEPRCQAKAGEHCWSGPPDPKERTGGRQARKTAHPTRQKAAFPEHDKLALVAPQSQLIYEFLSWLEGTKDAQVTYNHYFSDYSIADAGDQTMKEWLAEFFEIDLDKIEAEKRSMLDFIRSMNGDAE